MERDALLAHGVGAFIQESFMKRSDAHQVLMQPETGLLDTTGDGPIETINMPYAASLFVKELEAMHIQPIIQTRNENTL